MTDNKMYTIIWITVAVCLMVITVGCSLIYLNHVEKMAELGYEEGAVQGVQGTVWIKVK